MGKEVSSYTQRPARAPASRSKSRFYLSGKAAALPAPHVGFRAVGASRLGLWRSVWGAIRSPFRRAAPLLCV